MFTCHIRLPFRVPEGTYLATRTAPLPFRPALEDQLFGLAEKLHLDVSLVAWQASANPGDGVFVVEVDVTIGGLWDLDDYKAALGAGWVVEKTP
jgi:hypothetical protein